jgi:holo-[acyl-carrier protein] synthase
MRWAGRSSTYAPALAAHLAQRRLVAHLSISDETDYAVAFVVMEQS